VTLAWNRDDVLKVLASMLERGEPCKYLDMPLSNYGSASYDRLVRDGRTVGVSMFAGYSYNERSYLSLAVVDPEVAIGSEVRLVWGEDGGGTRKPTVERHRQVEIRAIVSPVPYSEVARTTYAEGWRSAGSGT
jgi:vanillate/3-O-methylgallate O-demethylase